MNTKKMKMTEEIRVSVIKECLKIYLFFFVISKFCQYNFMLLSCKELWISNVL